MVNLLRWGGRKHDSDAPWRFLLINQHPYSEPHDFSVLFKQVRHVSRCRSVCGTVRGWGAAPGQRVRVLVRQLSSAPEWTAPDRLSSTPGTLPTTAGDWPAACQSALAPPPCPMRMQKHRRGGSLLEFLLPLLWQT